MPNVGDIIRASDIAVPKGIVAPFYNVKLSGRYPIFWGDTEANTGWLVCDGGSDLHGGNVPNLINKFIMGTNTVSGAKKTGGAATVALTTANLPSHTHSLSGVSTSSSGAHSHYTGLGYSKTSSAGGWYPIVYSLTANDMPGNAVSGIAVGDVTPIRQPITSTSGSTHYHTLSGNLGATGSGTAHENLPPYYTLIYCVKLP